MAAPGWATKETAPLASKQTMHPCGSPLLFEFRYLPRFPFPVLIYLDWLKQPSHFTLHLHLLHVYCITWRRILRLCVYGVILGYFYYTTRVDAEFHLTKPRQNQSFLWLMFNSKAEKDSVPSNPGVSLWYYHHSTVADWIAQWKQG